MDFARATSYQPMADPHLWRHLARAKTAQDVVEFATHYGLLRSARDLTGVLHPHEIPAQAREPVDQFLDAAESIRKIARTMIQVRKATNGDATAMAHLRSRFVVPDDADTTVITREGTRTVKASEAFSRETRLVDADDRTVLIEASHWAAWRINDGLLQANSTPYVFDRAQQGEAIEPGRWRVGVLPETLLGLCYLTLALAIADQEPIEICPECERPFVIDDGRQRFCTPGCANRARFRRFKENRQEAQRQKGSRHGKSSRKR